MIKIKTNGEHPRQLEIFHEDGSKIKGVIACDVRMRFDEIVSANLWLHVDELSIEAEPMLSLDTIEDAALQHGYLLIPKAENG